MAHAAGGVTSRAGSQASWRSTRIGRLTAASHAASVAGRSRAPLIHAFTGRSRGIDLT